MFLSCFTALLNMSSWLSSNIFTEASLTLCLSRESNEANTSYKLLKEIIQKVRQPCAASFIHFCIMRISFSIHSLLSLYILFRNRRGRGGEANWGNLIYGDRAGKGLQDRE